MKKKIRKWLALMMITVMIFMVGCGGSKEDVAPLGDVNEIPENGIITKEQIMTIAGEDKEIQFVGSAADGITYSWSINANLIKNPQDQNLKIEFKKDALEIVADKEPDAVKAIGMEMTGGGLVAVSKLSVTIAELWEVEAASLVKEENGSFTEISPVTVTTNDAEGTTTLTMNMTTLEEECYILGTDSVESADKTSGEDNTTEKGEETTTKKEETTTGKKEETTTVKKEETTTTKKEETTTAKKEEATTAEPKLTCTISISCATILNNMDKLDPAKKDFVPSDGWILKKTKVTFEQGESVHDILKRVCREKGIHMESSYTPVYDSAYVEGINQIYEFDCGSQSGWMYKVNGWFPNYGCSQYEVSNGDEIAWVYTCDLGDDVGDNSAQ